MYYSLSNPSLTATFAEAVVQGIAPDRGLYFPQNITPLPASFFDQIDTMPIHDMAFTVMQPFVADSISATALKEIIAETLDFDFPIVPITDNMASLELFQGPTLAFKDVGARFMARCLGYLNQKKSAQKVTVLVATSGDTGGAVANGFLGVKGIEVVILYPKGKVSEVQEKQLTTLGQNITALEVDGVFDDCQDMVKTAFLDTEITAKRKLTSANSINVARWLPQMLYYFIAYRALKGKHKKLVVSVPSGNFGNICAGMMGKKLGLPIDHFIASTNVNATVPRYMDTESYSPQPTVPTISNAMDVSDPSNFVRIQKIYNTSFPDLANDLTAYSFDDEQTKLGLKEIYSSSHYVADPHGAVGYLGLKKYLENHKDAYGLFLETAHPIKFLDTVTETLGVDVAVPERIQSLFHKTKKSIPIASYAALKSYLINS